MTQVNDPFIVPSPPKPRGFSLSRRVEDHDPALPEKIAELSGNDIELESAINDLQAEIKSLSLENESLQAKASSYADELAFMRSSITTEIQRRYKVTMVIFGTCVMLGAFGIGEARMAIYRTMVTMHEYTQVILRNGALPCPEGPWRSAVALVPSSNRELRGKDAPPDHLLSDELHGTLVNAEWGGLWVRVCVREG